MRPLLHLAAEADASVAAELAKLRETEVSGEDGDWRVDAMKADRWLRNHRPALAYAADDLVETPVGQNEVDLGASRERASCRLRNV